MKEPWIAAVLSLFCCGLGHLYVGRPLRGVLFLAAPLVITGVLVGLVVAEPSTPVLILMIVVLLGAPVFYLYVVLDAHRLARTAPADANRWQKPLVYAVVLVIGLALPVLSLAFLRAEVIEAFKIPTQSMAPTIQRGDRILVRKWRWGSEDLERGDLVVFVVPDGTNRNYVKRVTALPGDVVRSRDGTRLAVPPGHFWSLGDNRANARDSRHFGAVPFESLVGRVVYRYWPPSRFGTLPDGMPGDVEEAALPPEPFVRDATIAANETAAIATLRNIAAAQGHFQAIAHVDEDGDGVGEHGGFLELSGAVPGRGGARLNPSVLPAPFRRLVWGGEVHRSGYVFRMYLPGPPDAIGRAPGVAEREPDGYPANAGRTVDPDLAETTWCCYAWPLEHGRTGHRTFFTNQAGDTYACEVEAWSGAGSGPPPDAALAEAGSIVGPVAADGSWKQINEREAGS